MMIACRGVGFAGSLGMWLVLCETKKKKKDSLANVLMSLIDFLWGSLI